MTVLYPDLCYNKVCYIGAALHEKFILYLTFQPVAPKSLVEIFQLR